MQSIISRRRFTRTCFSSLSLLLGSVVNPLALAAQGGPAGPHVSVGIARTNIGDELGPTTFLAVGYEHEARSVTASARLGWSYSYFAASKCIDLIAQDCGPGGFPHLLELAGTVGVRPSGVHLYAGVVGLSGMGNATPHETSTARFLAGIGLPLPRRTSLSLEIIDGPHLNSRPFRIARVVLTRHRRDVRKL